MRRLTTTAALLGAIVLGGAVAGVASTPRIKEPVTIRVVERPTSSVVIDLGTPGDSMGDQRTFANDVYDEENLKKVGRDQGECARIDPVTGVWECRWITFFKGGAITVEGPIFGDTDSVLVITGGRGNYKNARGSVQLKHREGATEIDLTFYVIP